MPDSSCATAPFVDGFVDGLCHRSPLRDRIIGATRLPEEQALPPLLEEARLQGKHATDALALARRMARQLRDRKAATGRTGLVQGLLQEYALSSREGVALMCLAEALLRIPDAATRDALIRDKIARGEWQLHAGHSPSLFVNAATWGLLLTGKLVATHSEAGLSALLHRLVGKGGEPLVRKGVDMAMRMMGEQFVTGETIEQAVEQASTRETQGFRYSYDMLGEAALTAHDAQRYRLSYEQAIHVIGQAANGRGVIDGPGISIKLSALHPRYSRAQHRRVMAELYPVLRDLTLLARRHDIGLNIDAEEADRLELSLDLLERLCFEPALAGWNGIGFVIQAYQKRCPAVVDYLIDLGHRSSHRLMVRLVKGAYWDSEIKRAQIDGQAGYPVFTRKVYTDVSYLACARRLLGAPDAIYPQFATHNAHTLSAIHAMADPSTYRPGQYEFQCLHGMGEPLYEQVVGAIEAGKLGRPCRIYAPVGTYETLLAYLVRRLLENGANTSFVNRIADPTISLDSLVEDPVATVERLAMTEGVVGKPHPSIALPADLYGAQRKNARGLDLADEHTLQALGHAFAASARAPWSASPLLASPLPASTPPDAEVGVAAAWEPVINPADHRDIVGTTLAATLAEVTWAVGQAQTHAAEWAATAPAHRADRLERAADLMEAHMTSLLGLLAREAGKTCANGIAEVREAVDFLRFYAAQARDSFDNATHRALGPVVCISPWNFPLAIFIGQIAAALAAGNPVLAKPAEQTTLVAAEAVRILREAGVPRAAVQLLPGRGETVGAALVGDARVQGVMFTGSTEVARTLQRTLAQRLGAGGQPVPLIAETGGQNAMIIDSSALVEQVVTDVMASAFDSAGQRCSALRVLCVQEEAADRVIAMLKGAMDQATLGNPALLAVDVGPVIDAEAQAGIEQHIDTLRRKGRAIYRQGLELGDATRHGTYVMPTLIELESLSELEREVFGPVLHVIRYRRRDLDALIASIDATGYGLTLGLHTRIDETISKVVGAAHAGNVYVNRNMVGAVVGVQPFGGEDLSGTGPKAGGPLYMVRLLARRPDDVLATAFGAADTAGASGTALEVLRAWAVQSGRTDLAQTCRRFTFLTRGRHSRVLPGPTGERNVYSWQARPAVLCLASSEADRLTQLAATLAVGSTPVWPADRQNDALYAALPSTLQQAIVIARDWMAPTVAFDAVLHHGGSDELALVLQQMAERPGPIVGVRALPSGSTDVPLEALVVERSLSVNTAAAGGNASLMAVG